MGSVSLPNRDWLTVYEAAQIMDFLQREMDGDDCLLFTDPKDPFTGQTTYPPNLARRIEKNIKRIRDADGKTLEETRPSEYKGRDYIYNQIDIDSFVDWLEVENIPITTVIENQLIERYKPLKLYKDAHKVLKTELTKTEFEAAKKAPLWELTEAIIFCAGFKASKSTDINLVAVQIASSIKSLQNPIPLQDLLDYAHKAGTIGQLKTYSTDNYWNSVIHTYEVEPDKFIAWLTQRGFDLPMIKDHQPPSLHETISKHTTPLLNLMLAAKEHYFDGNYNVERVTREDFTNWIDRNAEKYNCKNHTSDFIAKAMFAILNPPQNKKLGRVKKGK